jgi:Trypsin-like peptidase domain
VAERGRVCEVYTESARAGSGYLVTDRLVLTAAHAVAAAGSAVRIRRLAGGATLLAGRVVWSQHGEGMDAALLEITDARWEAPTDLAPVRWGRLVTSQGNVPCEAVGYPEAQEVRDPGGDLQLRDTEHVTGSINPLGTAKTGFYQVSVESAPPDPAAAQADSSWAGISGAAVLCGPLLTGVIAQDSDRFAGRRLNAIPAQRLLDIPEVLGLLTQAPGLAPLAEPVELQALASTIKPPLTPAQLLQADVEAVRFRGREDLLGQLKTWCVTPGGFSVRLLTGPGGQGKTRLAAELGRRMADEKWAVLRVAVVDSADYHPLAVLDAPALVVVDYAEARSGQVGEVAEKLAQSPHPTRLLLLARSVGEWQHDLASASPALAMAGPEFSVEIPVPALASAPAERAAMFEDAVTDLSARLGSLPGHVQVDWGGARERVHVPDLSATRYGTALSVQMTALAALLTAGYPDLDRPGNQPEDVLLDHEQRYWSRLRAELRIDLPDPGRTSRWLVAAGSLCTAADEDETVALVTRLPGLSERGELERRAAARLLHRLYGDRNLYAGSLQPDVLAEYLISSVLTDHPTALDTVLAGSSVEQARHGLTVLARAAVSRPYVAGIIGRLIVSEPAVLAPAAVTVASETENPAPLTAALDRLLDAGHLDHDLMVALDDEIPIYTQVHRDRAERVAARLVDDYRTLDRAGRPGWRSRLAPASHRLSPHSERLASALFIHAHRLAQTGRAEESLAAYQESIAIRQLLAKTGPAAHRAQLASTINDVTQALAALGMHREALTASEEVLDVLLLPADAQPDLLAVLRGTAVLNRGKSLFELGRTEEARADTEEAIALLRTLPDDDPLAQLTLAMATRNLAAVLGMLGRPDEEVAAAREAVSAFRDLADALPDWFTAELAAALVNLSKGEFDAGSPKAAVAAAKEAVGILRPLSSGHSEIFGPHLGLALMNEGGLSRELGIPASDCLAPLEESVAIWRTLDNARPGVHTAQLVMALADLAATESDLDHHDRALALASEAVDLSRGPAREEPAAFDLTLLLALTALGGVFGRAEQYEKALAPMTEAVAVCRRLAERLPDVYLTWLAEALARHAGLLAQLDRTDESAAVARESAAICRRAADSTVTGGHAHLGTALGTLSSALTELGLHEEALAVSSELVAFYRKRAEADQTAFRSELASALDSKRYDLYQLGRHEEALVAAREAAEIYQALAAESSGAYQDDLIDELAAIARTLLRLDRKSEAIGLQQEIVGVRRQQAETGSPERIERLARSLSTLASRLEEAGMLDGELAARQEYAALFQQLADADPASYGPTAGGSLTELAHTLFQAGDLSATTVPLAQAVRLYREAVAAQPGEHKDDLAVALHMLAATYSELNEPAEALSAAQEAGRLFGQLSEDDPDGYRELHAAVAVLAAGALVALNRPAEALFALPRGGAAPAEDSVLLIAKRLESLALIQLDRSDEAVEAAGESVRLARKVAEANPDNWIQVREFAAALFVYGLALSLTGHDVQARAAGEECVALLESLGPNAPAPILALLAQVRDSLADR